MLDGKEAWFRAILDTSLDAVLLVTADGTISYGSPAVTRVWGYPLAEVLGRKILAFIHPEDVTHVADQFLALRGQPEAGATIECRCRHSDGSWRWLEGNTTNLLHNPSVGAIIICSRDITERRAAVERRRQDDEAERELAEQLTALHEIGNELSKAESFDDLCRAAVELGRGRLGFDRIGIWFVEGDRRFARGSFGVDESGALRDERASHIRVAPHSVAGQVLSSKRPFVLRSDARVLDNRAEIVGRGAHATAALWNGEEVIGFVSIDNLLQRRPITERQCRILTLFASTLGHLCSLKRAQDAMAEADRRKDEFLAMLAHELRNPLGAISNSLHVMESPYAGEATRRRAMSVLRRQVQHQARLVDDLLDTSRISRGRIELHEERLDLVRLIHDAAEDYRSPLEETGLTLQVEVPAEAIWVVGDLTRLCQVLGNLLNNAVKFTEPGGHVTVAVALQGRGSRGEGQGAKRDERAGAVDPRPLTLDPSPGCPPLLNAVAVSVRDTGIGIDPAILPRLFESFIQGDRSLDRSRGGLGLGLALVKGLVELHHGEVEVHSAGPGQGATFTFLLPVVASAPAGKTRPTDHRAAASRRPRRILVVDDNRDAADTLRDLLELSGYEVETAHSGPAGLETARRARPDVVLCDIGLPGMDGYAVAAELRRDATMAAVCLVAVTGYGQDEDRRRSREAGFDHHLVKPVEMEELQALLEAMSTR